MAGKAAGALSVEAAVVRYAVGGSFYADRDAVQWHFLSDGAAAGSGGEARGGSLEAVLASVLPRFTVGLAGRMDETLMLLAAALGLPNRSALYTNLKDQGGRRGGGGEASQALPSGGGVGGGGGGVGRLRFRDLRFGAQEAVRAAVNASGDAAFFGACTAQFERQVAAAGRPFAEGARRFAEVQRRLTRQCEEDLAAGQGEAGATSAPRRSLNNPRHVLHDPRLKCLLRRYDDAHQSPDFPLEGPL